MSLTSAKMLRLTETRGSRSWPASFHAARKALIWAACWTWNGWPPSSNLSVELCKFMPSFAAQIAVALVAAPHQIRSRSPSEYGSRRNRPGGFGNIGRGLGLREALALQYLEEDLRVTPAHVGVGLALGRRITEIAPAIDHLLGRSAADAELQAPAGDDVGRTRVLRHVERVLVAHVDDGRADLDAARLRADGREQRERASRAAGRSDARGSTLRPRPVPRQRRQGRWTAKARRRPTASATGARASSARTTGKPIFFTVISPARRRSACAWCIRRRQSALLRRTSIRSTRSTWSPRRYAMGRSGRRSAWRPRPPEVFPR